MATAISKINAELVITAYSKIGDSSVPLCDAQLALFYFMIMIRIIIYVSTNLYMKKSSCKKMILGLHKLISELHNLYRAAH